MTTTGRRFFSLAAAGFLTAGLLLSGCVSSTITPLKGTQRIEEWVPATAPATLTATRPTTAPATQPLVKRVRIIDRDQTVRYVYRGNYDRIWEEAMQLLTHQGFRIDRRDYRMGVLTTIPRSGADIVEVWRRDRTGAKSSLEDTVNRQQRRIRLTIKPVEGKPEFYEIAVQVLVERFSNPEENIGGPAFSTGSGFGRTPVSLRSDYVPGPEDETTKPESARWTMVGHDTRLEKKILDLLFKKI